MIVPKDPFDDAYAADGESNASASPGLNPVASVDTDVDNIELNKPDEAPLPVAHSPDPELPEEQTIEEQVTVFDSPERAVEVSQVDDTIVSATAETVSPSVPIAEPQPTGVANHCALHVMTLDTTRGLW